MEKLKVLYRIAMANGKVEDGKIYCELTRKEVAEQMGVNPSVISYLLKFITSNDLPVIEFKAGQRGKKKIDRDALIEELKKDLGL